MTTPVGAVPKVCGVPNMVLANWVILTTHGDVLCVIATVPVIVVDTNDTAKPSTPGETINAPRAVAWASTVCPVVTIGCAVLNTPPIWTGFPAFVAPEEESP